MPSSDCLCGQDMGPTFAIRALGREIWGRWALPWDGRSPVPGRGAAGAGGAAGIVPGLE